MNSTIHDPSDPIVKFQENVNLADRGTRLCFGKGLCLRSFSADEVPGYVLNEGSEDDILSLEKLQTMALNDPESCDRFLLLEYVDLLVEEKDTICIDVVKPGKLFLVTFGPDNSETSQHQVMRKRWDLGYLHFMDSPLLNYRVDVPIHYQHVWKSKGLPFGTQITIKQVLEDHKLRLARNYISGLPDKLRAKCDAAYAEKIIEENSTIKFVDMHTKLWEGKTRALDNYKQFVKRKRDWQTMNEPINDWRNESITSSTASAISAQERLEAQM